MNEVAFGDSETKLVAILKIWVSVGSFRYSVLTSQLPREALSMWPACNPVITQNPSELRIHLAFSSNIRIRRVDNASMVQRLLSVRLAREELR